MENLSSPLDGTFDFNLCAKKYSGRAADFECNFNFSRIMLNVSCIARFYRRVFIFGCAWICVARLLTCWFHTRNWAKLLGSFQFMLLGHYLFAFNFSLLNSSAAWPAREISIFCSIWVFTENSLIKCMDLGLLWALWPSRNFPTHWTVQNIAILPLGWRRLGTHRFKNNHSILTASRYFMNTLHLIDNTQLNIPTIIIYEFFNLSYLTFSDPDAAWLRTRWKIWVIPARWTGTIITRPDSCFWLCFWWTQKRWNYFTYKWKHVLCNS